MFKPQDEDVIITNNEKLMKIGFQDGYDRAMRIIDNNPENLELLEVIGLPVYHGAYLAGIEAAKKERGISTKDTQPHR